MNNYPDLMIDIETLASKSLNAALVQIGLCAFNIETGACAEPRTINIIPDLDTFDVEWETLKWWMKQSDEARQSVFGDQHVCYPALLAYEAIENYCNYYLPASLNRRNIWAMPPKFDLAIVENWIIKAVHPRQPAGTKKAFPWKYNSSRDLRTLANIVGASRSDRVPAAVAHDAGHDAHAQALTAIKFYSKLVNSGVSRTTECD